MLAKRLGPLSLLLTTLVGTTVVSAQAGAEPCPQADRSCAKRAFEEGTAAFDRGAYAEALAAFENARAADDHPYVSFNIALCLERMGKLTAAKRELERLLPNPNLGSDLQKRVSAEQTQVAALLAHVSLETPSQAYVIEIDGVRASGGAAVELDPGEHYLRVTKADQVVFEQAVKLEPSERLRLRVTDQERALDLVVIPERSPARSAPPSRARMSARPLSPIVFYTAASASLVLGGLSLWSGLDVKSAYGDYERDLPRLDQAEANRRVEDGHARERRTNVLVGATVLTAAATAAIGIFWVDFGHHDRVALGVDGNGVRFRGVF